ncbi:unnamed protein product [Lupinus luteus]|uniref:Bifunctional inhibitor/plant lipid transfer protein/seed storage helical domain-containing protein n=1 Tax=Lupinus luteus TaxID=3873 RepID=A0AAV1YFI1_LUPLU
MDQCSMCMPLMIGLFLMAGISVRNLAEGQTLPPCGDQIFQCLNYINYTIPSKTCCIPLQNIYEAQKTCLCQVVFTPGILQVLGVTTTQAVKLGHSCGVDVSSTICEGTTISYVSALLDLAPSSSVEPEGKKKLHEQQAATPGGDEGGANRVAITGLSFVMLFWTYLLYN